jgi:hypothetical protein
MVKHPGRGIGRIDQYISVLRKVALHAGVLNTTTFETPYIGKHSLLDSRSEEEDGVKKSQ